MNCATVRLPTLAAAVATAVAAGACLGACHSGKGAPCATSDAKCTPTATPFAVSALLQCLGAPPEALYAPEQLDATPTPGLSVHTFEQETSNCGPVERRYVSYIPVPLGARTNAPVILVLHGKGSSAESMMTFQTEGAFNTLADTDGFVVVYGNGLPTSDNFPGQLNSGEWRSEYTALGETVDELAYLQQIVSDLVDRGVIAGGNAVYLVGQSNGGGMALSAGLRQPDAYTGVAAFMPFVRFLATAPQSLAGTRLRHVLFAYSLADPGLPTAYSAQVLSPLADGWARGLGFTEAEIADPTVMRLPEVVQEGQGLVDDAPAVQATRDSTVQQIDLKSANGGMRRLVFDHAGHFWPTPRDNDPQQVLDQFGLRNQDIEGAAQTWNFFGE